MGRNRHMKVFKSQLLQHQTFAGIVTSISLLAFTSQTCFAGTSEVKAETKTSTSTKAAPKVESKTTTKTETKTEAKTDTKTVAKTESKTDSKAASPQVIDFGASWCVPCKKFAPTFDKVGETYKGKVKFVHYDVESASGKPLATKYNINVMPTIMMLDAKGKVAWKNEGVPSEAELVKHTEALLK